MADGERRRIGSDRPCWIACEKRGIGRCLHRGAIEPSRKMCQIWHGVGVESAGWSFPAVGEQILPSNKTTVASWFDEKTGLETVCCRIDVKLVCVYSSGC